MVKIYGLPIKDCITDSDAEFAKRARQIGYVWTGEELQEKLNANFSIKGLILKIISDRNII